MIPPRPVLTFVLSVMMSMCWAKESPPVAVEWTPIQTRIVLEITKPQPLLDLLLAPQLIERIKQSEHYGNLERGQEFKGLLNLVSFLEARFGMSWRNLLSRLAGDNVTVALGPEKRSVIFVDSLDEQLLGDLHETFLAIARDGPRRGGRGLTLNPLEYRGVTGWVSQEGKVHTVIGNRLVLSSDESLFKEVIDLRSDQERVSIASLPEYQESVSAVGFEDDGRLFLNLKSISGPNESEESYLHSSNPMDALVSAGVRDHLRQADWVAMGLRVENDALLMRALADPHSAIDSIFSSFARPRKGVSSGLKTEHQILEIDLSRDLQAFYSAKDELFPQRTSGLIFFENMMGIFFSGRDFTDEILAELEPEFQLVAARQEYKIGPPRIQLPSMAMVFRMKNPEAFSPVVEEAWQKALGLLNFTRGQKAEPGLIIDRTEYKGVKFSYAYFAPSSESDRSDTRFNFRPALAMHGTHLILSSTDQLAQDLIEATMSTEPDSRLPNVHTYLEADIGQLALALEANSETLVRQNMLKRGNTQRKAESDISVFLLLLQQLSKTSLKVGWNDHNPWSELELRFDLGESSMSPGNGNETE